MRTAVVSYSFTGNNEAVAQSVADKLSADHIKLSDAKPRTMGQIVGDMLLGRTPKVVPDPECLESYELVVFMAPVWMGKAASPLRAYLQYVKQCAKPYAFFSVCGGALGPNTKLQAQLTKQAGAAPVAFSQMYIADLLTTIHKPTSKDTSTYRLSTGDTERMAGDVAKALADIGLLA